MANCVQCGVKLPFIHLSDLCDRCTEVRRTQLHSAVAEIIRSKAFTDEQIHSFKDLNKATKLKIYSDVYNGFENDKELSSDEIAVLDKIYVALELSKQDVNYDEKVLPYIYVNSIKTEGKLPTVNLHLEGGSQLLLKKNELVHYACRSFLKELKTVGASYQGGSRGVTFRIAKGMSYRIGSHRGHIQREEKLVETSKGALVLTNQRIILQPVAGGKLLNIPLKDMLSYSCYENGVEIWKNGRDKGYFFSVSGSSEIIGLCLGYLSGNN